MFYLLEIKGLTKIFSLPKKKFFEPAEKIKAVNNVSLKIKKREVLALVGESGSGKTTLGRLILKLVSADKGKIIFDKQEISNLSQRKLRPYRKRMQMIFQHPYDSLNPRMTIHEILKEGVKLAISDKRLAANRIKKLLELVGLAKKSLNSYPHELSGGERQRLVIARSLAVSPEFIVCDEPVSNLDVIIQKQILDLLKDLQKKLGLTYLFITHDLAVASHMAKRIAVMNKGKIVETGSVKKILSSPKTEYAKSLLNSLPTLVKQI